MIWIEIVCDGCNFNPYGDTYRKGTLSRLKKEVKQAGWKEINGKIYCPDCYKKNKGERK